MQLGTRSDTLSFQRKIRNPIHHVWNPFSQYKERRGPGLGAAAAYVCVEIAMPRKGCVVKMACRLCPRVALAKPTRMEKGA